MEIYPALDLLDGQCVRLRKGNFDQKTVYSENPKSIVKQFEDTGLKYLHLVDLSGARDPEKRQLTLLRELVSNSKLKIQCGGGIRSIKEVQTLLDLGVQRVVLGSMAVTNPKSTAEIIKEFSGDHITLALDVQTAQPTQPDELKIATQGWQKTEDWKVADFLSFYEAKGICQVLCTDIQRDGMMMGPNLSLYEELIKKHPGLTFQASGGIRSLRDLRDLESIGITSAIIGKAIYEQTLTLEEAARLC